MARVVPVNPAAPGIRGIGPGGVYRTQRPMVPANSPWAPPNPATLTTIRYVRKTGSDSNGGTSPADAWLTINKALTTASPGTVIYVGAGTYREVVTVTITPTPSLPVALVGDVDGSFTGDAGMVQWTAYTTNDKTAPSASALLTLNGKSNLTFQNLVLVGGQNLTVTAAAGSQNTIFRNVAFMPGYLCNQAHVSFSTVFGTPANWLFDQCIFGPTANASGIAFTPTQGTGTDYDCNIVIQNSIFNSCGSTQTINFVGGGAGANFGGGLRIRNCLSYGFARFLNAGNSSTTIPCTVAECVIQAATGFVLGAQTLGQIVEDCNLIASVNSRSNVAAGAHSKADGSFAPLWHFGQERVWGGNLRPFGEPMASSPLNAFGADGAQTPYDARNGPRPTGILVPAVGAYERGNNFLKETGTVHTGSNAISVIGDGFYDFYLPIDAGSRTISVFCQRDSNYVGPPPRLQILPNQEIGVGDPCAWGTPVGVGAFEQLVVTVNPTGSGIVILRVISSDVSGIAKTVFDSIGVA